MSHLLAIDLGTGSCRAVLFDEDARQIAIALAVFPPVTRMMSWSSASSLRPDGGQGKKWRCVISPRPRSRSYHPTVRSGFSIPAVGT